MISPSEVLLTLHRAGGALVLSGERLRYRGPSAVLTDEVRAAIGRHHPVLKAVTQAATPGARLPGVVPSLAGNDHQEAEALILFALGLRESARCHEKLITDPERRRILQEFHDAVAVGTVTPAVAGEG